MKKLDFEVEDLTCPSCARSLESALKYVPGVIETKLSFTSGRLRVTYDEMRIDRAVIHRTIKRAGYKANEVRGL